MKFSHCKELLTEKSRVVFSVLFGRLMWTFFYSKKMIFFFHFFVFDGFCFKFFIVCVYVGAEFNYRNRDFVMNSVGKELFLGLSDNFVTCGTQCHYVCLEG